MSYYLIRTCALRANVRAYNVHKYVFKAHGYENPKHPAHARCQVHVIANLDAKVRPGQHLIDFTIPLKDTEPSMCKRHASKLELIQST